MNDEIPRRKPFLTLHDVAAQLGMHPRTLAGFLKSHPAEPPLFAKPGRDYIISASDAERIYAAMKDAPRERPPKVLVPAVLLQPALERHLRKLTTPAKRKSR